MISMWPTTPHLKLGVPLLLSPIFQSGKCSCILSSVSAVKSFNLAPSARVPGPFSSPSKDEASAHSSPYFISLLHDQSLQPFDWYIFSILLFKFALSFSPASITQALFSSRLTAVLFRVFLYALSEAFLFLRLSSVRCKQLNWSYFSPIQKPDLSTSTSAHGSKSKGFIAEPFRDGKHTKYMLHNMKIITLVD